MSRSHNYVTLGQASYTQTNAINCKDFFYNYGQNSYIKATSNRNAPNGVFPFIAPTFMSATRFSRGAGESFDHWQGTSQYIDRVQGQPTDEVQSDAWDRIIEARSLAREQAANRFYDSLTSMDLSETVVEARQTAKLVDLAETVSDMTRVAAKRFGLLKVIGAGWMWKNYGVEPVVNDIYSTLDLVNRQAKKPFHVTKSATVPFVCTPLYFAVGAPVKGSIKHRISVYMQASAFDSIANMTSMDPAYIAWTAIPWTFITDYIFNVGGYLRQMELRAVYGTGFLSGTESQKTYVNGSYISMYSRLTGWPCMDPFTEFKMTSVVYEEYGRIVLYGMPGVVTPSFRCDLNSRQLLNVAAALTTFLGK